MTNGLDDDRLVAALALAVAQKPRANLEQLARAAGTSKATLYRFCHTRESLVAMLTERATAHMRAALAEADLATPPHAAALRRLTQAVVRYPTLYLFWNAPVCMDLRDTRNVDQRGYVPSFYNEALERFFFSGQKEGVFRIDMPAKWLANAYDSMVYAAIGSAQRGEIATVGMTEMIDKIFLSGAQEEAL